MELIQSCEQAVMFTEDFIHCLLDEVRRNLVSDNHEFHWPFERRCHKLKLSQIHDLLTSPI